MGYSKTVLLDGGPLGGGFYCLSFNGDRLEANIFDSSIPLNPNAYYLKTSKTIVKGVEVYTWIDLTIQNDTNSKDTEANKASVLRDTPEHH